jgi:hypothetical protein
MLALVAHLASNATAELVARVKVAARVLWWGSALDRPTFRGPRPVAPGRVVRFGDSIEFRACEPLDEQPIGAQDSRPAPAPPSPPARAPGPEVAHRDLKPAKVIVCRECGGDAGRGHVYVCPERR